MFKYLQNIFLTFANHQATLISWYCICHLLQTSRPSHVTVTSPSTSYYAAKSISLLSGGDRRKVIIIKTQKNLTDCWRSGKKSLHMSDCSDGHLK